MIFSFSGSSFLAPRASETSRPRFEWEEGREEWMFKRIVFLLQTLTESKKFFCAPLPSRVRDGFCCCYFVLTHPPITGSGYRYVVGYFEGFHSSRGQVTNHAKVFSSLKIPRSLPRFFGSLLVPVRLAPTPHLARMVHGSQQLLPPL